MHPIRVGKHGNANHLTGGTDMRGILVVMAVIACAAVSMNCYAAGPLMVDKNLFALERKPLPPEAPGAPAQPNKSGLSHTNMQLDGVMIQGNTRKALLRLKGPLPAPAGEKRGKPPSPYMTVREGQQVGEYRVVKIETKSISLEKEGQTFVVSLFA